MRGIAVLRLLRPEQWTKNLLVMAPWVFAGLTGSRELGLSALAAAMLFAAASSMVYVFNDYIDSESDRVHPVKRFTRPIASGAVTPLTAFAVGVILFFLVLSGAVSFPALRLPLAAFVVVNLLYTTVLKHLPVLDLITVASGYLIRVYAGAVAVGVPLSVWMGSTTVFLSLFLVSSKRYVELSRGELGGRGVLSSYSPGFLNVFHWAAGVATLACYLSFVLLVRPRLLGTIPLVVVGLARYAWLTQSLTKSESPSDVLLEDGPLLLAVIAWSVLAVMLVPGG